MARYSSAIIMLSVCLGSVLCSNRTDESSADEFSPKFYVHKGTVFRKPFRAIADAIENLEVRDDDVWVCSFPKSGTTWVQEMVWNIANDLDFEGAKVLLELRMPYLEFVKASLGDNEEAAENQLAEHVEKIAKLPSPRYIKTHLPFHLLPRQLRERKTTAKIVYVSRNPRDACISYYHFTKWIAGYRGSLEDYCRDFMRNKVADTPYWNNVNGYYERRNDGNILFLKFEDMKRDLPSVIRKTAKFLGKELSDQQVRDLEDHLSFENMRENPAVNREDKYPASCDGSPCDAKFIRKGEVGEWKTAMSQELIREFDEWTKANSKEF